MPIQVRHKEKHSLALSVLLEQLLEPNVHQQVLHFCWEQQTVTVAIEHCCKAGKVSAILAELVLRIDKCLANARPPPKSLRVLQKPPASRREPSH